jgi:phage shock protein A
MFKTVLTLFRGSVGAAEEDFESRNALLILDQQMRDAAVDRAKRTLALAIAQDPEAENTLRRLRERQMEARAADEALVEIDAASGPLATAEKLAEQGFEPRLKSTADDVLARLKAKRTQA